MGNDRTCRNSINKIKHFAIGNLLHVNRSTNLALDTPSVYPNQTLENKMSFVRWFYVHSLQSEWRLYFTCFSFHDEVIVASHPTVVQWFVCSFANFVGHVFWCEISIRSIIHSPVTSHWQHSSHYSRSANGNAEARSRLQRSLLCMDLALSARQWNFWIILRMLNALRE